jgi:hypothetical protein
LKLRLARYSALVSATPPLELEQFVRGLLVHYFFHVSNKAMVEVTGVAAGQAPRLNLLAPTVFKGRGRVRVAGGLLAERYGADNGRVARIIMTSTVLAFVSFSTLTWLFGVRPV